MYSPKFKEQVGPKRRGDSDTGRRIGPLIPVLRKSTFDLGLG